MSYGIQNNHSPFRACSLQLNKLSAPKLLFEEKGRLVMKNINIKKEIQDKI
jgi:hypothetical protein